LRGGSREGNVTFSAGKNQLGMKNLNPIIISLLILMLASTFIGVPLNGGDKGWAHVYDGELAVLKRVVEGPFKIWWRMGLLVAQCLTHLALFSLPFSTGTKRFFSWLVGLPLLYLLLQAATFFYFVILLVPFIILWIITLIVWQYDNKRKTNTTT
jgi:hypothetical protein